MSDQETPRISKLYLTKTQSAEMDLREFKQLASQTLWHIHEQTAAYSLCCPDGHICPQMWGSAGYDLYEDISRKKLNQTVL